jgi:hypothetical protein
MKLLQGTIQPSGYRMDQLVDPEDLGLLRFEETGELPEGLDFAIWWNGAWREGRCYNSTPSRTFVTYRDAQRLPLRVGTRVRLPLYTLSSAQLLELAQAYAHELGYTPTQQGTIVGEEATITSGDYTRVEVPIGDDRPPVEITINLSSNGDIRLVADTETFRIPGSGEDTVG